jgi:predicted nucleotidyltransferase
MHRQPIIDRVFILDFLKKNKTTLLNSYGVTKIALFGSYARGEEDSNSDIDLLIEMPHKSFHAKMELRDFLAKEFNRKVDLGYFDSVRSFIMHHIQKDLIYA